MFHEYLYLHPNIFLLPHYQQTPGQDLERMVQEGKLNLTIFELSTDGVWRQEEEEYIKTTKDSGNERLDFRFAY
jgi:hypothetical protein